jgi:hypothetical protein
MSLYPEGHDSYKPRGLCFDQRVAEAVWEIAHECTLQRCINGAALSIDMRVIFLEGLRAKLFRGEQLINTQPLIEDGIDYADLPDAVPALLETLKATERCLEEWLESRSCQAIMEKYPRRPRTKRRITP